MDKAQAYDEIAKELYGSEFNSLTPIQQVKVKVRYNEQQGYINPVARKQANKL